MKHLALANRIRIGVITEFQAGTLKTSVGNERQDGIVDSRDAAARNQGCQLCYWVCGLRVAPSESLVEPRSAQTAARWGAVALNTTTPPLNTPQNPPTNLSEPPTSPKNPNNSQEPQQFPRTPTIPKNPNNSPEPQQFPRTPTIPKNPNNSQEPQQA
ncbi:hypothetical protein O3P69_019562 [Scylla paramamosain]|uniref:Uncharacterized protein n=1 Tax=Scylla paramamosain TaxID=85552 RepID=A0AAW0SX28_SCYPA